MSTGEILESDPKLIIVDLSNTLLSGGLGYRFRILKYLEVCHVRFGVLC